MHIVYTYTYSRNSTTCGDYKRSIYENATSLCKASKC